MEKAPLAPLLELTRFNICIDNFELPKGRMYHRYKDGVVNFYGIESLVLAMDNIMDETGKPQMFLKMRNFNRKKLKHAENFKLGTVAQYMDFMNEIEQKGEQATFIVQIRLRQNTSWQGTVRWVEKGKSENFRSALELIKLIDDAGASERISEKQA